MFGIENLHEKFQMMAPKYTPAYPLFKINPSNINIYVPMYVHMQRQVMEWKHCDVMPLSLHSKKGGIKKKEIIP